MASRQEPHVRPDQGDILLVVHDFKARSSDELTLAKGDRVELLERDDEFGDGWFLGKHMVNGNSGLFPEVYTRPAPRGVPAAAAPMGSPKTNPPLASLPEIPSSHTAIPASTTASAEPIAPTSTTLTSPMSPPISMAPTTTAAPPPPIDSVITSPSLPTQSSFKTDSSAPLPLSSSTQNSILTSPSNNSFSGIPSNSRSGPGPDAGGSATMGHSVARLNTGSQDSHMLHETLHVINEHITDMRSPQSNGNLHQSAATDSGSEYSSHLDHRMSYIQGEETDEEEDGNHTRPEVEAWTSDEVAEYLFTVGVEKRHCEVFRDQEITGEVILGIDQSTLFLKAFELGPVGRRLKTWQKIKALQDEVNGVGISTRRTTGTYGSDVGSEGAGRVRSRTNTLTSSIYNKPSSTYEEQLARKRSSITSTPRLEPSQTASPVSPHMLMDGQSPTRNYHEKRPSAASVRELHHSRRHSSNDFRIGSVGSAAGAGAAPTPKPQAYAGFALVAPSPASMTGPNGSHRKQPSFDRNWTLGGASQSQRPVSSAGLQEMPPSATDPDLQDSAVDLDRGYFSGPDVDNKRRNVLKKRDSTTPSRVSRQSSYADEQRVRAGTALSRHSRYGSVDSVREQPSNAAQKYYGITPPHPRRTNSTQTTDSMRPLQPSKDAPSPTVTKLDDIVASPSIMDDTQVAAATASGLSASKSHTPTPTLSTASATPNPTEPPPVSPSNRQALHGDWLLASRPGLKSAALGLRAISDAVTGHDRSKMSGSIDSPVKGSPIHSPTRTGSTTPSVGPSFDLDSPDAAKSPSTATTAASNKSRKKSKKETSAYTRGLNKLSPREAMADADYSGWMKKKSSNLMTTWKPRLFVLKGRRLAYYYSEDDDQEKGLIDISFHRVLPADNERLTSLHATMTGASNTPTMPSGSNVQTIADAQASMATDKGADAMFIFKLVPPRAGLSRAVNFTKPMVHYFAVPNIQQGRLWMAALMKATIDRDDTQAITTTYQQKTISLTKARQMRHRPPALMGLDDKTVADAQKRNMTEGGKKDGENGGLGIVFSETDSGVSGLDKLGLQQIASARLLPEGFGDRGDMMLSPKSA